MTSFLLSLCSNAGLFIVAEARLVASHVQALRSAGVRDEAIGVITPYNAQVERIPRVEKPPHGGAPAWRASRCAHA